MECYLKFLLCLGVTDRMLGKVLNAIAVVLIGVLFGHAVLVSVCRHCCLIGC